MARRATRSAAPAAGVRLKRNRRRFTDRRYRARHALPVLGLAGAVVSAARRSAASGSRRSRAARRPHPRRPGGTAPGGDAFAGSPTIGGCPIFPRDNPWNSDVSQAPVDARTTTSARSAR